MPVGDILQIIGLLLLLLLSAFFSSAETAFTTVNKIHLRTLSEAGNKKADRVLRVTEDPGKLLSAILIGNNLVNISASSLATALAIRHLGSIGAGIATGVLTFLVLVFGEVTPKTIATLHADSLSLAYSGMICVFMAILTPFIFIIHKVSLFILFLLRIDPHKNEAAMTEEELRVIVDVSQETGVIEHEERNMIHNLFDFSDSDIHEIMIPRIDMVFVPADATYPEVREIFREHKFTRLPVYEETPDNVIGIINMKDLFLMDDEEETSFCLRDHLRDPFYVFDQKRSTYDLFLKMRKESYPVAILIDEYGVTVGMISMEDLLEEIVGEIRDEYDTDEVDAIVALSDHEYRVSGSASLNDVNDALGVSFESDDYDTIGGYCLELLDHLPEADETLTTEDGIFMRMEAIDNQRITSVYIRLPENKDADSVTKD